MPMKGRHHNTTGRRDPRRSTPFQTIPYAPLPNGPLHTSTLRNTLLSTCSSLFLSARLAVVDAVDARLWAPSVLIARPRRAHSAIVRGFVRFAMRSGRRCR